MMFPREEQIAMKQGALPEGHQPTPHDVCCGRGKKNWNHEGNTAFRKLIREHVKPYQEAINKQQRNSIIDGIVELVYEQGGRFLKQDDSKKWYDIGEIQAREKVGHSLRDQVNAQQKAQQQQQ